MLALHLVLVLNFTIRVSIEMVLVMGTKLHIFLFLIVTRVGRGCSLLLLFLLLFFGGCLSLGCTISDFFQGCVHINATWLNLAVIVLRSSFLLPSKRHRDGLAIGSHCTLLIIVILTRLKCVSTSSTSLPILACMLLLLLSLLILPIFPHHHLNIAAVSTWWCRAIPIAEATIFAEFIVITHHHHIIISIVIGVSFSFLPTILSANADHLTIGAHGDLLLLLNSYSL